MWPHRNWSPVGFSTALAQVPNQFLAREELRLSRPIPIKIAHQTNAEGDVVEEITVNMTAVDLAAPPIPHFNFPITGGRAVADHEMISETILHPTYSAMIIIEYAGVSLSGAAIVDHDEFPAVAHDWCAPDFFNH
jgi:hypothetical protein